MSLSSRQLRDIFNSQEEGLKHVLPNIINLSVHREGTENLIISTINKLLSSSKHQLESLQHLTLIIQNCSSSAIIENAFTWLNYCMIKYTEDVLKEQKLKVIGHIIERAYNQGDFNKKFVSEYISKIVDRCLTASANNVLECRTAVITLTICMKYYSSWFTNQKTHIEQFLLTFLQSNCKLTVRAASVGFHYLQQVGGAGIGGINHRSSFSQSFDKLCSTIQNLFNELFEGEDEIYDTQGFVKGFQFKDDSESYSEDHLYLISRRITNCLHFIETMIRTKFPVAKEVEPKNLLHIIIRGISIHKCITKDFVDSVISYKFSLLLLIVQVQLVRILRIFIIWQKENLLMFSYEISKSLVDVLERTKHCSCFKYESTFEETTCKAVNEWLRVSRESFHEEFQTVLIAYILGHITPHKSQVTLSLRDVNQSDKWRKTLNENRMISETLVERKSMSSENVTEVTKCTFSLSTLKCLLDNVKLKIKLDLFKNVIVTVLDSLTTLQISKVVSPYIHIDCQTKLYEVLIAFYSQDAVKILPPLHTTIAILNRGAGGKNRSIVNTCEKGLQVLEILSQPVCPSMYPDMQQQKADNFVENNAANTEEVEMVPEVLDESGESEIEILQDSCLNTTYTESDPDKNKELNESNEDFAKNQTSDMTSDIESNNIEAENENNENIELEKEEGNEEDPNYDSLGDSEISLQKTDNINITHNEPIIEVGSPQEISEICADQKSTSLEIENDISITEQKQDEIEGGVELDAIGEPSSKKAKLEDEIDDVFEEGLSENENFIENDSFVDEVKEY